MLRLDAPWADLLVVGDPHVTPDELSDCQALADLVLQVAERERATILLLGDQYHNHSVLNLDVISFWRSFFAEAARRQLHAVALVGNHDRPTDGRLDRYSMQVHEGACHVVAGEPAKLGGALLVSHYKEPADFLAACAQDPGAGTVFCHQAFDASRFENGYYAGDKGIELNLVPQKMIVSGHIHDPQDHGKLWHPGAPRWRILPDANTERALWLLRMAPDGSILGRTAVPTGGACKRIMHLEDRPEAPLDGSFDPKDEWRVDVYGTKERCQERAAALRAAGARVRTYPDRAKTYEVKESDGIVSAFRQHFAAHSPRRGTPRDRLAAMAAERVGVHVQV